VQAGLPSVPEPDSIDQAAAAMVTRTNCWLAQRTYPGELQNQVSHETIYRSLFIQARGVLKKELLEHLRARGPPLQARQPGTKRARPDKECRVHQQKTGIY
jgi:hypothetical protein